MSRTRIAVLVGACVAAGVVPAVFFLTSSALKGSLDADFASVIISNTILPESVSFLFGAAFGGLLGLVLRRRHPMAIFWMPLAWGLVSAALLFGVLIQVGL